jgi:hypothetical protein
LDVANDLKMNENHILIVLGYIKALADFFSCDYHIDNEIMYNMYLVSRLVRN